MKDIDTLERIQRRATKMISEVRDLTHEKYCVLQGDPLNISTAVNNVDITHQGTASLQVPHVDLVVTTTSKQARP